MIDDELVITVRVRLTRQEADDLARLADDTVPVAVGRVFSAALALPGQVAGVELAMPSFDEIPTTGASP